MTFIASRRRGRDRRCEEQVANARDSFVSLAPVSQVPAETVRDNWSALLPGQPIPLIGERRYDHEEDC